MDCFSGRYILFYSYNYCSIEFLTNNLLLFLIQLSTATQWYYGCIPHLVGSLERSRGSSVYFLVWEYYGE